MSKNTSTLIRRPAPTTSVGGSGSTNQPVVVVEGLTKRYSSGAAVDDLSFEVPAGEVIGLLGPNGAGKTTAMKMLLGLVKPTSGRVTVLGAERGSPDFADAIRRVGALIEAPALYERLSARRNLELQGRALGAVAEKARIDELLEMVDLSDRADDPAGTYSLGMKQRLGIAVALLDRPDLAILDEPANGLDPAGIVEMRSLLRRIPEMGTTVLVSSHQLTEVQQACDRLVVLDHGSLIASGTTAEIIAAYNTGHFTIRLEPTEVSAAIDTIQGRSITVVSTTSNSVTVTLPDGWTGRDLNRVLADAGTYPSELINETVSLETAFLTMTGASNENS